MHRADVLGDVLWRGEALAAALAVVEERGVLLLGRLVPDVGLDMPVASVAPNVKLCPFLGWNENEQCQLHSLSFTVTIVTVKH